MNVGANSGSGVWWDPDTPAVWLGTRRRPGHDGDASEEDDGT